MNFYIYQTFSRGVDRPANTTSAKRFCSKESEPMKAAVYVCIAAGVVLAIALAVIAL